MRHRGSRQVERLKISEDVAGATFLAMASSAPELFHSILATFVPAGGQVAGLFLSGAKASKSCRSRQELSNEYLVFTCKIWLRYSRERAI